MGNPDGEELKRSEQGKGDKAGTHEIVFLNFFKIFFEKCYHFLNSDSLLPPGQDIYSRP